MQLKTIIAGIVSVLPLVARAARIMNLPYFPNYQIAPVTSFETDIEVPQGYDVSPATWMTIAFSSGTLSLLTESDTKRTVEFYMWDLGGNKTVEVVQLGENVVTPDSSPTKAVLNFGWESGVTYRMKIDTEYVENDTVFSASIKIRGQWHLIASIRGHNYGRYGLRENYPIYQYLSNQQSSPSQPACGIFSGQCYRLLNDDFCYPSWGVEINTSWGVLADGGANAGCWGYGVTKSGDGMFLSVGGSNTQSEYCNHNQNPWVDYDHCAINQFSKTING
ncbi:hypothetical protein K493DRAFT_339238 [Basidiobolus meristosporus CBS 931.73]|uniref:DUF5077 domain-containing protein n=1 Tax=Basidiobolus meristosporus CBS 931.73 TaxID=1314790 RepID=A0A1Y1Y1P2_9FUNG|nr:hypothetical protein K493DRAFT_339238 [Basidiobolus meristosporus CBS 931.73]|eukprot:ORX91636.1 hypothetical protein K493DRAFT_339238 [Basidiobolus meristosporus CBS 931.73]